MGEKKESGGELRRRGAHETREREREREREGENERKQMRGGAMSFHLNSHSKGMRTRRLLTRSSSRFNLKVNQDTSKKLVRVDRVNAIAEPELLDLPKAFSEAAPDASPVLICGQVSHSLTKEREEVTTSMEDFMTDKVYKYLKPVDKCWQASDYLPDPSQEDFIPKVQELRERTLALPDEYLVVLVGDMITEEALPTYMSMLNTIDATRDETGSADTVWARWTREWTAEENRHGDLLNKYLYLSGRCDMRSIEVTIQHLITNGFNPDARKDPYIGFVYTSFQERATKISHGNVARLAKKYGDTQLG